MRNIVKNDLSLLSLKMQTRHQLADLQKEKRLARAKILLNKFKDDSGTDEIIFTDEKLFTVEAKFNRQNNRVLAKSSADIEGSSQTVFSRQKPSLVMVWGGISKKWRCSLIFVEPGVKVNTNAYIERILTPALEQAKKHFKDNSFIFQ